MQYINFLVSHFRPYYKLLTIVLFIIIIDVLFYISVSLSLKIIIDELLPKNNKEKLIEILAALFIGFIIISLLVVIQEYLYTKVVVSTIRDLRHKIFEKLNNLPVSFYSKIKTSDSLSYFSNDLVAIEAVVMALPASVISPLLRLIGNMILLVNLDFKLAIICLILCPLVLVIPKILTNSVNRQNYEKSKWNQKLMEIIQESLGMQLLIKSFNLLNLIKKLFYKADFHLVNKAIKTNFISTITVKSGKLTALLLQIIILAMGSLMVCNDILTIGTFVVFQNIFTSMAFSLSDLVFYLPHLIRGTISVNNIERLFDNLEIPDENKSEKIITQFNANIAFQNVTFSYNNIATHLAKTNFTIEKGQSVAFVGISGSGKSTILNLIMRFYDVSSGKITVDGTNIGELEINSLREIIGYICQDNSLFNISIKDNIKVGKLNATDEEVQEAAQLAEIHDAIMLMPDAYNTKVGERGKNLSAGQRQRITIARALIRKPAILILDEATSSLDPISEHQINQTLEKISTNLTVINITHRLNSTINAHNIFTMKDGNITEFGTHKQLIEKPGLYKQLWDKQNGFVFNEHLDEAAITAERLRLIPIFKTLPDDFIIHSAKNFKTISCEENYTLLRTGEIGNVFYIIARGMVEIFKNNQSGTEESIGIFEDGDYFGEIALLKSIPRTATVKTLTHCIFLTLNSEDFSHLLSQYPAIKIELEKNLEKRTNTISSI